MIGIVLVSHSEKVALGAAELASQMAKDVKIIPAGGLNDGSIGTDFEKIMEAINTANSGDGVAILMDLGSAVMTTSMATEMSEVDCTMIDGPIVEGAVVASICASTGGDFDAIQKAVDECKTTKKF